MIFLLIADAWRCASGPEAGNELLSDIMLVISSASFSPSLYSRIHESPEEAITWRNIRKNKLISADWLQLKIIIFIKEKVIRLITLYTSFPSLEVLCGWSPKQKYGSNDNHGKQRIRRLYSMKFRTEVRFLMWCVTPSTSNKLVQQIGPNIKKN